MTTTAPAINADATHEEALELLKTHPDEYFRAIRIAKKALPEIGYEDLYDFTFEQRKRLPSPYHRPVFDDLIRPRGWFCEVCWDEGEITGWPCEAATNGGVALADALGVKACR